MIDLHSHTCLSDGSSSPSDLLAEAQQIGLSALAITDHDTLAGFDAALPLAPQYEIELVCGIELSTRFHFKNEPNPPVSVHLLGYFPEHAPDEKFRNWLGPICSTRRGRNIKLMEKLQSSNISISWDDFPHLGPDLAGRPHFAKVLVAKEYVADTQEAFDRYLGDTALAGIERELPSTEEAIERIVGNGGLASLAHPGRFRFAQSSTLTSLIQQLVRNGLRAIEVYHSDHTREHVTSFLRMAVDFNLLVTGGSDYHGENKPDIRLGTGRAGNLCIPDGLLATLKSTGPALTSS
jgi:3',5'-nucleoside bisphosphate phosphatase